MLSNNKKIVILGAILTVILFTFGWNRGRIDESFLVLLVSSALCCYLLFKNRFSDKMEWSTTNSISKLLDVIFFILLVLTILLLLNAEPYVRPTGFFIIVTMQSSLIALDALTFRTEKRLKEVIILLKVLAVAAVLRWSLFYVIPGLTGVDPFGHVSFARLLMLGRHIPVGTQLNEMTCTINPYYLPLPVFHLCLVVTSVISGMDLRSSMILSVGFFEVVSLSFIYLLGKKMFNSRVGLIAALLIGVSSNHIWWGHWIIPMTFGLSMFTFLMYTLFGNTKKLKSRCMLVLFLLLSLYTILLNPVASTLTWLLFFLYTLLYLRRAEFPGGFRVSSFMRKSSHVRISMLFSFTFLVAMLSYWIYVTGFFQQIITELIGFRFIAIEIVQKADYKIYIEKFFDNIGMLSFLIFSSFGALHLLVSKSSDIRKFSLVFIGGLFMIIYVASSKIGIQAITPARWLVFSEILLAIPAALGFILITTCTRNKRKKTMLTLITMAIITFFMITSTCSNFDNPIYTRNINIRWTFLTSEMQAASFSSRKCNSKIWTDSYYLLYYRNNLERALENVASINFAHLEIPKAEGLLVIRSYIIDHVFLTQGQGGLVRIKLNYDPRKILENQSLVNKVYDNNAVTAYSDI